MTRIKEETNKVNRQTQKERKRRETWKEKDRNRKKKKRKTGKERLGQQNRKEKRQTDIESKNEKEIRYNGCHRSSVDSSVPSIQLPWVRIPCTPSMILSI